MSRWLVYLKAELTRRNLLRGGALLSAVAVLPNLPGCGASNPTGSGSTTGASGGSSGSTGGTSTGSTSTSSSTTGTSGTSTTSGTSGTSGTTGTTGSSCTQDANTFVVAASQIPVGGGVVFTDNRFNDPACGTPQFPANEFVITQPTAGTFVALSAACTHACCNVQMGSGDLWCNCHGSRFDLNGGVTHGPAMQPLPSLPVCTDGTNVYVQLA